MLTGSLPTAPIAFPRGPETVFGRVADLSQTALMPMPTAGKQKPVPHGEKDWQDIVVGPYVVSFLMQGRHLLRHSGLLPVGSLTAEAN